MYDNIPQFPNFLIISTFLLEITDSKCLNFSAKIFYLKSQKRKNSNHFWRQNLNILKNRKGKILMDGFSGIAGFTKVGGLRMMKDRLDGGPNVLERKADGKTI